MSKLKVFASKRRQVSGRLSLNHYLLAIGVISLVGFLCRQLLATESYYVVSFILLFVVSILATFMKLRPILLASALGALVWNYFFIPPHYTLHIEKPEDILMFAMFFVIALLNGIFTFRVREQEQLAKSKEESTNSLFLLTKELSKAGSIREILTVAKREILSNFGWEAQFILQNGQNNCLNEYFDQERDRKLNREDLEFSVRVFQSGNSVGREIGNPDRSEDLYFPLPGVRLMPGVVVIKGIHAFFGSKNELWLNFLNQIGSALEREFLGEQAQKVALLDESDRLYKTLFNSISHELRIPVSTIMGAADTMLASPGLNAVQSALAAEVFTASVRLNRLIENLLNMSRLESGRLSVRLDWYDVNDLVNKVTEELEDELKPFRLEVQIPEDLPPIKADFGLMEQVLYNLLLNACQYAPIASEISVECRHNGNDFVILIADRGPGFPEEALSLVFSKFFRVDARRSGGLGLGLSIVKGFVEAHKGTIILNNRPEGGALFSIHIPSASPAIENFSIENS